MRARRIAAEHFAICNSVASWENSILTKNAKFITLTFPGRYYANPKWPFYVRWVRYHSRLKKTGRSLRVERCYHGSKQLTLDFGYDFEKLILQLVRESKLVMMGQCPRMCTMASYDNLYFTITGRIKNRWYDTHTHIKYFKWIVHEQAFYSQNSIGIRCQEMIMRTNKF